MPRLKLPLTAPSSSGKRVLALPFYLALIVVMRKHYERVNGDLVNEVLKDVQARELLVNTALIDESLIDAFGISNRATRPGREQWERPGTATLCVCSRRFAPELWKSKALAHWANVAQLPNEFA
ncbi:Hypothetical Protein FCC1311_081291 [Hondaea fermentalgiana]|uniref:Uncharacterized protein n=1 Tax=Hondaea fermentalgiana TaxID=2315210 RepID=A0A2R5GVW0_9STRA|nr:Hypothetical Protein FCC1311_081291 [Hondaea fermentalgiana]|eukprot:GBG34980.1 Hypothetical Protein FCC1311_081291 [Hondaea fermentalgiana]